MDILVTFEDGTTELRAANSYVHWAAAWRLEGYGIGRRERYETAKNIHGEVIDRQGRQQSTVWRITGQDPTTKALSGEWQSCRIESVEEQIARLTRERDAARRLATLCMKPLTPATHGEMRTLVDAARDAGWLQPKGWL